MTTTRTRRPSMAQRPILTAIADLGGVAVQHADALARMDVWAGVGSWVAIASAGWVTVDRRTPDNRGGILADYRYTLTPAGWAAIDRTPPAVPDVLTPGAPVTVGPDREPGTIANVVMSRCPDRDGAVWEYDVRADSDGRLIAAQPRDVAPADLPWDDGNACRHCRAGANHTDTEHRAAALAAHDTDAGYEGDAYGWECECGEQGHGLPTLDAARDQADQHRADVDLMTYALTPAGRDLLASLISAGGTIIPLGIDPDTLAPLVAARLVTDLGTTLTITNAGRREHAADTWAGRDDDPYDPDDPYGWD